MKENAPHQGLNPAIPPQEDARWDLAKAESVGMAAHTVAEDNYSIYREGMFNNPFDELTISRSSKEKINKDIARLERPFERLYDLNPESFSQVSLPEFIDASRQFNNLSEEIEMIETVLPQMQKLISELQNRFENKWVTEAGWVLESLLMIVQRNGFIDRKDVESLKMKFKLISKDFDGTRRQELEKCIEIIDEYLKKVTVYSEDVRKRRQTFFEKYKIEEEVHKEASA